MEGYFGYKVNYVMNITDVDDKVCSHLPSPAYTHMVRSFCVLGSNICSNNSEMKTPV